jgi:hypothetical protein
MFWGVDGKVSLGHVKHIRGVSNFLKIGNTSAPKKVNLELIVVAYIPH